MPLTETLKRSEIQKDLGIFFQDLKQVAIETSHASDGTKTADTNGDFQRTNGHSVVQNAYSDCTLDQGGDAQLQQQSRAVETTSTTTNSPTTVKATLLDPYEISSKLPMRDLEVEELFREEAWFI